MASQLQLQLVLLVALWHWHVPPAAAIRCYECAARVTAGDSGPCLWGDYHQLRRVQCIGPSVCAAYHYTTVVPGAPSVHHVTRGCQALRHGATCEDIFNQLRERNEVLPGQHTCATCSTDLCNASTRNRVHWAIPLIFSGMIFNAALRRYYF